MYSLSFLSRGCGFVFVLGLGLSFACRTQQEASESMATTVSGASSSPLQKGSYPIWAYDGGPDLSTPMGRELAEINASIPYFPGISNGVYGDQMFRPAFGPISWRMMQKPNSVKILFIGQDGTHIAEAAGRPATAGFGGRAQDLAKYFGVSSSAAFINTYAFTIRWQYGAFDTPFVVTKGGKSVLNFGSFTGNQVWLVSQDLDSPITKWRNRLIDWILRNNKDSLKMIVLFGGAARDAAGSYIVSKGGTVGTRYSADDLKTIQIPEFKLEGAGSNKQTAVPLASDGSDLYQQFVGKRVAYSKDPAAVVALHKDFKAAFDADSNRWLGQMVFSKGGLNGSGMLHPAQLGGYDIDNKIEIQGKKTISLKGLKISSDYTVSQDILITQLPHPTSLSLMTPAQASKEVGEGLKNFRQYVAAGWKIEADKGFVNTFAQGQAYKYSRADMGTEYYDFGAPNSRMVNVSSASRSGSNVIVFGTRDKVNFEDENDDDDGDGSKKGGVIKDMTFAKPAQWPSNSDMWLGTSREATLKGAFDAGPGEKFAKIMKSTLPQSGSFVKEQEINGDFGHYRGTFKNPKVVIIADPDGEDDLITARALTGARGQYLHGLMQDIGVGGQYLVIKTAPYSKNESDQAGWKRIMENTETYRDQLFKAVFAETAPQLVITDGIYAAQELKKVMPKLTVPVVSLKRDKDKKNAGIAEAAADIRKIFPGTISGKMADIPRSHLTFYARVWEGTSGDRVVTSPDPKFSGRAFAVVAPQWAYTQKFQMSLEDITGIKVLNDKLVNAKLRLGGESVPAFLKRPR